MKQIPDEEQSLCSLERKNYNQSSDSTDSTTDNIEKESWGSSLEYFLSIISYGVGLGNLWRFPCGLFLIHVKNSKHFVKIIFVKSTRTTRI